MNRKRQKTLGKIAAGCGCLSLVALSAWLAFVVYIGVQGRGSDEEAAVILGAITICVGIPVLVITVVGFVFALRKDPPDGDSPRPGDGASP